MTPNVLSLYAVSFGLIGLLGLFARHNRKTGWVKQRSTAFQDLLALVSAWRKAEAAGRHIAETRASEKSTAATPASVPSARPSPKDESSFTGQLSHLQTALTQLKRRPSTDKVESATPFSS